MRQETETVFARWLEDECVLDVGNEVMRTPAAKLWASWRHYAMQNDKAPGRLNDVAAALVKRGVGKYRSSAARGYCGIALRGTTPETTS